jgi:hypothetical protein
MGFWRNLFGKKKPDLLDMDIDTEATPVVVPTPVAPVLTIEEVEKQVEDLLRDLFPGAIETYEAEKSEADALEEKKRKRSEAAKKAAATRAANKAKKN